MNNKDDDVVNQISEAERFEGLHNKLMAEIVAINDYLLEGKIIQAKKVCDIIFAEEDRRIKRGK